VAERRRLPVLQSPPAQPSKSTNSGDGDDPDAIPDRPPWHWVGFGTVAIFAVWLPLTYVAQAVIARVLSGRFGASATPQDIAARIQEMTPRDRAQLMAFLALPTIVSLALSAFAGGYLVARFGASTGIREAATAGAMTALVALGLSLGGQSAPAGGAALATAAVTVVVAVGFAALGGRAGVKRRAKSAEPKPSAS